MTNHSTSTGTAEPVPTCLPRAVVTVGEIGAVSVMLDSVEFPPPNSYRPWTRAHFGALLDALTLGRTRTVRIEVRESNGSIFTDIVHAVRTGAGVVEPPQPDTMRRARHRPTHQLFEIAGSGFIPGEDVTVALAVSSAEGSADGKARGLVDLSQLADHRSEIMLIGRVSGVIVSERLPS